MRLLSIAFVFFDYTDKVKTGVYRCKLYFLIFALKHRNVGTQWGGFNVYSQSMFWAKIRKI